MDISDVKAELRTAVRDLSDRGLYFAAQWAAEHCFAANSPQVAVYRQLAMSDTDREEEDLFLLAKSCVDLRDYRRAAAFTKAAAGHRARFIHWYSTFLAGEQAKEDLQLEASGTLERASVQNPELVFLKQSLSSAESLDGFGLYLLGVVYQALDDRENATKTLIASVNAYPCNWSAWRALESLCSDRVQLEAVAEKCSEHWMLRFFLGHGLVAQQQYKDEIYTSGGLEAAFPRSSYIKGQIALALYHNRDYDSAAEILEHVRSQEPDNLSNVDILSNILYVRDEKAKLAELARDAQSRDRYRPETCCVIGNYFSSKGDHERALRAFMRALRLNPSYLSAWTLMGHEFVFLKNAAAAVQAYRRAVDIDPRDYRAWYGLGQTYEILQMPLYALHYFRKAASQRPTDARMWSAMAACYETMSRKEDAVKCYEKAVLCPDRDSNALSKLAGLQHQLGNDEAAAHYYTLHLQSVEGDETNEVAEALLFLAQHHKAKALYADAEIFCLRLLDAQGPARDEARAMLRELQALHGV